MALAGGGSFVTLPLSLHTLTNLEVIKLFWPVEVRTTLLEQGSVKVEILSNVR